MSNIPVEVFLIPVGLAILGLIIWLITAYLRAPGETDSSPENATSHRSARTETQPDVLAIHINEQGIWEVFVYGIPYRSLDVVPDPSVQQKVVDALKILAGFSRTHIQKHRAQSPAADAFGLGTKEELPPLPIATRRETAPPRSATGSVFMPQINLAKEIGAIVEELQARSPSLAKTSIRLQNAAGGGVLFVVDGQLYQNLEDIPNLEIQALIRAATRQWEKQ